MKKILVVNNDFDTMSLLKSWLEKKDYKVKYTGSYEEINNIISEFAPDLIIIDILQREALDMLRAQEGTRMLPILLMTGYTLRGKKSKLPVNDTIEKPFNLTLLEKKIQHLTQKTYEET